MSVPFDWRITRIAFTLSDRTRKLLLIVVCVGVAVTSTIVLPVEPFAFVIGVIVPYDHANVFGLMVFGLAMNGLRYFFVGPVLVVTGPVFGGVFTRRVRVPDSASAAISTGSSPASL